MTFTVTRINPAKTFDGLPIVTEDIVTIKNCHSVIDAEQKFFVLPFYHGGGVKYSFKEIYPEEYNPYE